jgi:hypothetical protein
VGRLVHKGSSQGVFLEGETTIGRSSGCNLHIDRGGVSSQHAAIRWTPSGWLLRDLGSRNGTLCNGEFVPAKTGVILERGDELTFGERDEVWLVDDLDPPGLILRTTDGTDEIHVSPALGLKPLPSPEEPTASLFHSSDEHWYMERDSGETARLEDGETVQLMGRDWRCIVPAPPVDTVEPSRPILTASVQQIRLTIAVARDEETAQVVVHLGGSERRVGPSVPLYLLAFLADQRAAEPGWVETEEACNKLRFTRERLNVDVYRVRESIRSAGVAGATDVIQRRRGMLRIGLPAGRVSLVRGVELA